MKDTEFFDLVDKKGNVVGIASRDECHSNPKLLHPVVHFTLYNPSTREILLTQRSFKKKWDPGKHVFFGEHVLAGESYEDGLKRGSLEELQFEALDWLQLGEHVFKMETQTELVRFYIVMYQNEELKYDKEEIERIFWIKVDDISSFNDNVSDMTQYWIDNVDWITLS